MADQRNALKRRKRAAAPAYRDFALTGVRITAGYALIAGPGTTMLTALMLDSAKTSPAIILAFFAVSVGCAYALWRVRWMRFAWPGLRSPVLFLTFLALMFEARSAPFLYAFLVIFLLLANLGAAYGLTRDPLPPENFRPVAGVNRGERRGFVAALALRPEPELLTRPALVFGCARRSLAGWPGLD